MPYIATIEGRMNTERAPSPQSAAAQRHDQAVASALEILKRDPHRAEAWEYAALMFMKHGKWNEARGLLESAVTFVPDHPLLPVYYALALMETGCEAEAFTCINGVLARAPENPHALFAKAEILKQSGYYDLARNYYAATGKFEGLRKASLFGEGVVDFVAGDCGRAIPKLAQLEEDAPDAPALPLWNGKPDPDLHLVLYGSQGFGDIMMFLRTIDAVRPLVGRLTLRVPYQLAQLVRDSWPDLPLFVTRDPSDTRDVSLLGNITSEMPVNAGARYSLIRLAALNDTFDARASAVPYLCANPEKIRTIREHLAPMPRPHIGIVWAGSPRHQADHARSVPLDTLLPILDIAKPHLVSLQMQPQREAGIKAGLFDGTQFINDFSDTAALISALDLLITVDTAPAHLAGALKIPVWTMIPFGPMDWRWQLGREDTLWYPSMRLFRQSAPRNWPLVAQNVAIALQKFLAGDARALKPPVWKNGALSRHPHALSLPGIANEAGF